MQSCKISSQKGVILEEGKLMMRSQENEEKGKKKKASTLLGRKEISYRKIILCPSFMIDVKQSKENTDSLKRILLAFALAMPISFSFILFKFSTYNL